MTGCAALRHATLHYDAMRQKEKRRGKKHEEGHLWQVRVALGLGINEVHVVVLVAG